MQRLENKQNITSIIMKPVAYTKCAIGQDWYKNELEIFFSPRSCYPDYMEVNSYIMESIDGQELNIEDVVQMIYDFLASYDPQALRIIDHIRGCKTHFDVDVIKE